MCIRCMIVTFSFLFGWVLTGAAQPEDPATLFGKQHQAGVRIGVWSNLGNLPSDTSSEGSSYFLSDIGSGSFHFEAFAAYRISRMLIGELSIGVVNRGDVEWQIRDITDTASYYGHLVIYPMFVKVRFYPFMSGFGSVHPYLMAGGGVTYARHNLIAAGRGSVSPVYLQEKSAVSMSAALGGGVDWPLASVVGLDFQVQYIPINYSKGMFEARDWSGLTVTVGVKYLFEPKKKNKEDKKRRRGDRRP